MSSKRQEQAKLIEKLSKRKDKDGTCHFCKPEIEKLLSMYNMYAENNTNKKLDRLKFRDILHDVFGMTDDMLMDRVFRAFDRDSDGYVNHDEWVMGLSVFLKGLLEEKTKYSFSVYDLNQDGYISREEMFQLLKNSLVKQPSEEDPDEGVKDLVEICLKKMDHDHDSRVSYTDWEESIKEEPLLLEAFGVCLPTPQVKKTKPQHVVCYSKHHSSEYRLMELHTQYFGKCQTFLNLISDEYSMKF